MEHEDQGKKKEPSKGKGTIISIQVSEEDATRLQQAFAEGKLEHLGVTGFRILSPQERDDDAEKGKWTAKGRRKDVGQENEGLPPR